MKSLWSWAKPYVRWVVLGGTLFFLITTLRKHWQEASAIQFTSAGYLCLAFAVLLTLLSITFCGWVWTWILAELQQPVRQSWGIQIYLKTQVAKYLPGNIWHYYGRIRAVTDAGGSLSIVSVSVLLEPLLTVAAALVVTLVGSGLNWITVTSELWIVGLQILSLGIVVLGVHPYVLNRVIQRLSKLKNLEIESKQVQIERYLWRPLVGELVFLGLRGLGFLFTLRALMPIYPSQIFQLFSAFSFSWLLGLVVPGAPEGIGIFETTVLALLRADFPTGLLLSALAVFRLVSLLAEASGAGLAILSQQCWEEEEV